MRTRVRVRFAFVLLTALAACEHGAPFRPEAYGPDGPLGSGSPTRLTFNPGQDLVPAWLDENAIAYTGERRDRADQDRCLAFLPAAGGAISRYVCRTTATDDSVNVFEDAAFARDSIVYVRASSEIFPASIGPDLQQLVVAAVANPNDARVLQTIPFTAAWGTTYDALSHVTWLSPGRVAAVGERVTYPRACRTCAADTVRTGLGVLIVDFAGASPVLTHVTDADSASSVAASANGDTLYFTRDGDSRVYRHTLSTSQTDTLYDFGVAGIARDVSVANGKLAAVVGGNVGYVVDSVLGGSQPDHGGFLYVVSSGGSATQLGDSTFLFRRPALSPSGTRLVVAAWSTAPTADIWLYPVP